MKSSLRGERVKKDPVFSGTMRYEELMSQASVMAFQLYRGFPKENKSRNVYQQLTGEIIRMLKAGVTKEEIIKIAGKKILRSGIENRRHLWRFQTVRFSDKNDLNEVVSINQLTASPAITFT